VSSITISENTDTGSENVENNASANSSVPDGFVPLRESISLLENGLKYHFWKDQIVFLDADEANIYQTSENNNMFIVIHNDKYYVSEKKLSEIIDVANVTFEQRNRIFYIGEPIWLVSTGPAITTLTVTEVSYAENIDDTYFGDDEWICRIKIDLEIDCSRTHRGVRNYVREVAWHYFDSAENAYGRRYNEPLRNHLDEIVFKLPSGEKAQYLHIKSPFHRDIRRTIDISQESNEPLLVFQVNDGRA